MYGPCSLSASTEGEMVRHRASDRACTGQRRQEDETGRHVRDGTTHHHTRH